MTSATLPRDVQGVLDLLAGRDISQVYLVACGGSLSIMYPAKVVLDRHAPMLPADVLNADEFVRRDPARVGPGALVILCSQTGTTPETVAAAAHAHARGAATVALTMAPDSPLAREAGQVLVYAAPYTTGVPIDPADSNYAVLYRLIAGLIQQRGGPDLVEPLLASLAALGPAIEGAKARFGPRFDDYAARIKNRPVVYTMASGVNWGAAYSFAICVLMEMQWIGSQAIHADEFFHGPFEVVDRDTCVILLMGLDPTRPTEERARAFLHRFGDPANILVLDAAVLDLSDLAEPWQAYLLPLVFFDALWDFAFRLARLRGHPMLTGRRYMKKLTDY